MKELERKIVEEGTLLDGGIVKIDSFLNHRIDTAFITRVGQEFYRLFGSLPVSKILTCEASGIAVAFAAAQCFDVPVVFAKKGYHKNVGTDVFTADVFSFTKGETTAISVSKKYLAPGDRVLIIDDFLADGQAAIGLKKLVDDAGAELLGIGIVVEKGFQPGGKKLRDMGLNVKSLAIIDSMVGSNVTFRDDD